MTNDNWNPEQLKREPITTEEEVQRVQDIEDLKSLKPVRIVDSGLYDRLVALDETVLVDPAVKVARFGTGEDSRRVEVEDLEPGVIISGDWFGITGTVIVQEIRRAEEGKSWKVTAAHHETGDVLSVFKRPTNMVDTWGTL